MQRVIDLKPIKEQKAYYDVIEAHIKQVFKVYLYYPLLAELDLKKRTLQNDNDALLEAIKSGRIELRGKTIKGKFSAKLSRELRKLGARFDRKTKVYRFASAVPVQIRAAAAVSLARFEDQLRRIDQKLAKILPGEITENLKTKEMFDTVLWKTDKKLRDSLKNITLVPELSAEQRAKVSEEWQENLDLWVTDFTEKEILDLRKQVKESVLKGDRQKAIADVIQKSYGVASRKAKFLARQETSLLLAKFKETRYQEAGVKEYRWKTVVGSPAHPVRPSHKILDGKIFRFDDPPITTEPNEPVRRNNPGEDFNCRCFAVPIVKF